MPIGSRFSISRRAFVQALIGGIGATGVALAQPPSQEQARKPRRNPTTLLLETYVAGLYYYDFEKARNWLPVGEELVLRREPENSCDELAIEVLTIDGAKLGYVPRARNADIARLLDAGRPVVARVSETIDEHSFEVGISIHLAEGGSDLTFSPMT